MDTFGRLPNELNKHISSLYHAPIQLKWVHIKDETPVNNFEHQIVAWSLKLQKLVFCTSSYTYYEHTNKGIKTDMRYDAWCENNVKFEWWAPFNVQNYIHLLVEKPPLLTTLQT